jgi:isopentenyl-diphosphate Delta-isomerase
MRKRTRPRTTSSRKQEHVELTLQEDVGFRTTTTGLERLRFVHNALPEIDVVEVDTSVRFLGRRLSLPLLVSGMTGGYREALRINRQLAEACAEAGLGMGVGSQRQALEDTTFHRTFSIVREVAPDLPILGNIGAAEVAALKSAAPVARLAELIRADAFAVHLNPLQELLQPEGSPAFRGVLRGIGLLVRDLPIPVVVKEIGAGISQDVARRLLDAGVRIIGVTGAGGTSWAGVEILRTDARRRREVFWDWGIPTATAVKDVAALRTRQPDLTVIASGGISSGMDIAKSIALGADLAASARPILQALARGGIRGVRALLADWSLELRGAMFLTGSRTTGDLQHAQLADIRS